MLWAHCLDSRHASTFKYGWASSHFRPAFDGPDSDPDPTSSSWSDFRVSSLTIVPSIFRVVKEYLGLHRERYLGKV